MTDVFAYKYSPAGKTRYIYEKWQRLTKVLPWPVGTTDRVKNQFRLQDSLPCPLKNKQCYSYDKFDRWRLFCLCFFESFF